MTIIIYYFRENSLIIIGKISKIAEYNKELHGDYPELEETKFNIVDVEKLEYVIGFQGEELIFKDYLYSLN